MKAASRSQQARLTRSGGISWAQLLHIEQGKTEEPGISKLVTLARVYHVYLADLTAFFDDPAPLARSSQQDIRRLLRLLPESKSIANTANSLLNRDPKRAMEMLHESLERALIIKDAADVARGVKSALGETGWYHAPHVYHES